MEAQPPLVRLRDRRRGREGRRPRAARRDGLHEPRAAVGDRVQVPARGEDHRCCANIMVSIGRTGRATPFARARAGVRRRLHRRAGDAAQPGRGRAQGRARRRHRDRAQGRRRDPRGRRAGAREAQEGRAASGSSRRTCPVCGAAARAARGRGRHPLRQRRLPGAARAAHRALRRAGGDGHRGARRGAGHASSSRPGCSRTPPTSTRSPSSGSCRSSASARRRRSCSSTAIEALEGAAARRCSSGSASATSARPPRPALARELGHLDAIATASASRSSPRSTGVGPA